MRNAILLTLVGIVAVSLLTVGVVYALPQESPAEFSSGASAEALSSEDTSGYPYLLRSYDGKLAVFTDDLVEPDLVFDVSRAHAARSTTSAAGTRGCASRITTN